MYKFNTFGTCVEVSQVQFPLILKYQELGHPCHPQKATAKALYSS